MSLLIKGSKKLYTTGSLIMLQSRLFHPQYAGPARWVIFNTCNRKAYAAIGPDIVPDVIKVLTQASSGASAIELEAMSDLNLPPRIDLFTQNELLQTLPNQIKQYDYLNYYHDAVFDYPFNDYSDESWKEKDRKLMDQYMALWEPPPIFARRTGEVISLPVVADQDLFSLPSLKINHENALAIILKYTFGAIGIVNSSFQQCLRRTSPSGGARHPTEAYIFLPKDCYGIKAGYYAYEPERHCLVKVPNTPTSFSQIHGEYILAISLKSLVERAMWRYRDPRSFRPVLIDIGHIIETLCILLSAARSKVQIINNQMPDLDNKNWFLEPELCTLIITDDDTRIDLKPQNHIDHKETQDSASFLTNPAMHFMFMDGNITAYICFPFKNKIKLTLAQFYALNHCLPSNRGDRITTLSGIQDVSPECDEQDLNMLVSCGALLKQEIGASMYEGFRFWSKYNWYLSLIAHFDMSGFFNYDSSSLPDKSLYYSNTRYNSDIIFNAMLSRKTTRSFSNQHFESKVLLDLMTSIATNDFPKVDLYFAPLSIDRFDTGIYKYIKERNDYINVKAYIDRLEIQNNTIGQQPASSGALTIWIVSYLDGKSPIDDKFAIINSGRLAHRIILQAESHGIGVFMTPAVNDLETCKMLSINPLRRPMIYLLSLGYKKQEGA